MPVNIPLMQYPTNWILFAFVYVLGTFIIHAAFSDSDNS